jgi:methylmalonyl-CoA/ethylmalonyl-CoA epimerase
MLSAIDHIGVAVEDLDATIPFYRDVLGLAVVHRETVTEQGVDAVLLDVGDGHVELIAPLGPDIEATLAALTGAGVRLIDERPRIGIRKSRVAFVHPAATGGVLTEIVQPAEHH